MNNILKSLLVVIIMRFQLVVKNSILSTAIKSLVFLPSFIAKS
jgi:hypothetical protein